MVVIKEFAWELGREVRSVEEIATGHSEEEVRHMRKIGLDRIPTDNQRMLQEMIRDVCGQITKKPDCILITHSLPFIRRDGQETDNCWKDVPTEYMSGMH